MIYKIIDREIENIRENKSSDNEDIPMVDTFRIISIKNSEIIKYSNKDKFFKSFSTDIPPLTILYHCITLYTIFDLEYSQK